MLASPIVHMLFAHSAGLGFKLLFRSWCPYDCVDKRTLNKSSQRALCCTYATSSRLHFSYLFDLVWSSYSCPLIHALCKKIWDCFLFLSLLSISHPFLPPLIFLSGFPLPSLKFFSSPGPSPCSRPFLTVWIGVCVNLSEISLFHRLTASTGSEGTASSQDMKNASHKFVIRPWVIMAKAPITSD